MAKTRPERQWQAIAITSGAFASFNGLFAKLTTSSTTSGLSQAVINKTGLRLHDSHVDLVIRITVFALSFVFSGIMWALYTRALSAAPSSIQASIVNTSSNFIITALLGQAVFGEKLSLQWWFGASLLITGSVIIGRRDESQSTDTSSTKKEQ